VESQLELARLTIKRLERELAISTAEQEVGAPDALQNSIMRERLRRCNIERELERSQSALAREKAKAHLTPPTSNSDVKVAAKIVLDDSVSVAELIHHKLQKVRHVIWFFVSFLSFCNVRLFKMKQTLKCPNWDRQLSKPFSNCLL
jgi:hypothetical protein